MACSETHARASLSLTWQTLAGPRGLRLLAVSCASEVASLACACGITGDRHTCAPSKALRLHHARDLLVCHAMPCDIIFCTRRTCSDPRSPWPRRQLHSLGIGNVHDDIDVSLARMSDVMGWDTYVASKG